MKFMAVYAKHFDGSLFCLFIRKPDFDVEAWVKSREKSLHLLGIVAVTTTELDTEET